MRVLPISGLDKSNFSLELQGKDCGGARGLAHPRRGAAPGRGPSLHTHDYAEIMIVQEGTGDLQRRRRIDSRPWSAPAAW